MILRLILIAVVITLLLRAAKLVLRGVIEAANPTSPRQAPRQPVRLVRDPVCGTHVPPANAVSLTSDGTTHYFCSEECRRKFRKSA